MQNRIKILRNYSLFALLICTISGQTLFAQDNVDMSVIETYVVHCETIAEMRQAQQKGVLIFEYKGRYFVNIGDKYEGVNNLEKAVWLRQQKGLPLPNQPQSEAEEESGLGTFYNPQLMLFPFVNVSQNKEMLFTLPTDEQIPTSKIMIHPSPFVYDDVKFAPIDLAKSLQKLKALGENVPNPEELPASLRNQRHFAVTGKIAPQPSVKINPNRLMYWIGVSVVDAEGNTIWKKYGDVEADMGFKTVHQIDEYNRKPQFLLLFTLAKGSLDEMLRPQASMPEMDASGYDYHILNSIVLEMGPDWFPPIDKATEEEYRKMVEELQSRTKIQQ